MANAAALIRESIWRNREFRALPRQAQCTYMQLCSQKDLDCAGLLTLNVGLLAKGCDEVDHETICRDLETLEAHRFVIVDEETDEVFIRAYMRTAEVVKSPNVLKSALKSARLVASGKLRSEVAAELRRLHRADADKVADQIDPQANPSGTIRNPSRTLPELETLPEPSSTGTVTGLVLPTVVGNHSKNKSADHYVSNARDPHVRASNETFELATAERGSGLSAPVSIGATRLVATVIRNGIISDADRTILRIQTSKGLSQGRSDDDMAECLRIWLTKNHLGPHALLSCLTEVDKCKLNGHTMTGTEKSYAKLDEIDRKYSSPALTLVEQKEIND